MRRLLVSWMACALAAGTAIAARDGSPGHAAVTATAVAGVRPAWEALPGGALAPVRTRTYRLAGRIRPLLFWFGRDDVGSARIVWRRGEGSTVGYDLLVGTDPTRAPRGLNRWGFVAEQSTGLDGALLALMTGKDEANYEDASAAASSGAGDVRAIRCVVNDGRARWLVSRVPSSAPLTLRDVDTVITRIDQQGQQDGQREQALPPATRPGFLGSVAELIDRAVAGGAVAAIPPVRYVFGPRLYELRLRTLRPVTAPCCAAAPAVRAVFETRALATGTVTTFEIVSGTTGDLAGVPLLVQWQPRWWLKLELHLQAG